MSWQLDWAGEAQRDLKRCDRQTRERLVEAIEAFARDGTGAGSVKKLQGSNEFRLRVGKWRIRFELEKERRVLRVLHVLKRDEAY